MAKILAVFNNPGGAQAIIPVVESLLLEGFLIHIITTTNSIHLINNSIPSTVLNSKIDYSLAYRILNGYKPDLLLLGTSEPEDPKWGRVEAVFTKIASQSYIPAVSVLDHWCGYKQRYSLDNENKIDAIPDIICVMDTKAKTEILREGFNEKKIIITGNPAWDSLSNVQKKFEKSNAKSFREKLGIKNGNRLLLFVSEPIRDDNQHIEYGYSEYDVFEDLLMLICQNQFFSDFFICIAHHPRDNPEKYTRIIDKFGNDRVNFLTKQIDNYQIGMISDIIIGMTSMLLVEYSLLGLRAISYQPTSHDAPPLILGYGVKTVRDLNLLKEMLIVSSKSLIKNHKSHKLNATKKINKVIDRLIKQSDVLQHNF